MTAKEFLIDLNQKEGNIDRMYYDEYVEKAMKKFAKYHVQKALEEFTKKIETERVKHHYPPILFINKTDMESSYPLENIK